MSIQNDDKQKRRRRRRRRTPHALDDGDLLQLVRNEHVAEEAFHVVPARALVEEGMFQQQLRRRAPAGILQQHAAHKVAKFLRPARRLIERRRRARRHREHALAT